MLVLLAGCEAGDPMVPGPDLPVDVQVLPADPVDGEALRCVVQGDGAPVASWTWRRNGEVYGDARDEVAPGVARFGDTWACEVATDGASAPQVGQVQVEEALRPNVLIALLDDVGVNNLTIYGALPGQPVTPHIDALAAEGIRFDTAWAMPMCSPARAALLTGRMPRRYGIGNFIALAGEVSGLPLAEVTLPEMLALAPQGAYASGVVGKWHLASDGVPDALGHPLNQGFDHARVSPGNLGSPAPDDGGYDYFLWPRVVDGVQADSEVYATTQTVDDALDLVATLPEPWLLYVAFHAPHVPLHVPPAHLLHTPVGPSPTREALAVAMLEAVDTELGRLLDGLGPMRARTTVLLAGDNGEAGAAVGDGTSSDALKGSVYEGGVRVPLVVAGAGVAAPGSVSEALVSLMDVFPTLAGLGGVHLADLPTLPGGEADGAPALDGVSFLRLLREPASSGLRTVLYAERFRPNGIPPYQTDVGAVRDARYKLIRTEGAGRQFFALEGGVEGPELDPGALQGEAAEAWERLKAAETALRARGRLAY